MITKEKFKELIGKIQEYNKFIDKLYDEFKIDAYDCRYTDYPAVFFDELIKGLFGTEGLDLVSWWLFEEVDHKIYQNEEVRGKYFYSDEEAEGEVVEDVNDVDDLYDYLVETYRND